MLKLFPLYIHYNILILGANGPQGTPGFFQVYWFILSPKNHMYIILIDLFIREPIKY